MVEIIEMKDDIIKVLFYMNVALLFVGIFVASKGYFITAIVLNIIFNGTYMIINKNSHVFNPQNKAFKNLDKSLGFFSNMGKK